MLLLIVLFVLIHSICVDLFNFKSNLFIKLKYLVEAEISINSGFRLVIQSNDTKKSVEGEHIQELKIVYDFLLKTNVHYDKVILVGG